MLSSVSIVIVLHESADVVGACVSALPADVEVVVVDNASSDGGADVADQARAGVKQILSPVNLGFGGGCNLGWRASSRENILFLNPDARISAEAITRLADRLSRDPWGIVGPAVIDSHGAARPCRREFSVWRESLWLLPAAARWLPLGWRPKLPVSSPVYRDGGRVAFVEGACFMVSREALTAIGGFDEDFFLYCEEESLALRLQQLGGAAWYEPRVKVEHVGQTSTLKIGAKSAYHMYKSRGLFARKRDGNVRGQLGVAIIMAGLWLSFPAAVWATLTRRRQRVHINAWFASLRGLSAGACATLRESRRKVP